jgi:DnaK suppressor protein
MPSKGGAVTKKDVETFRKKLMARRSEIGQKLHEFRNESKELEDGVARDLADKAESSYTKEFLLSLSDAEQEELFQIDAALRRIQKGDFGICQTCQKDIGRKRLNALPWTALCIECQEKAESEAG